MKQDMQPIVKKNRFQLSKKQKDNLGGITYRFNYSFFCHLMYSSSYPLKEFDVYSPINSVEVFAYRAASIILGPCFFTAMTALFFGAGLIFTLALPFTIPNYLLARKARIKSGNKTSEKETNAETLLNFIPIGFGIGIYLAINIGLSIVLNAIDLIICTALAIGGKIKGAIENCSVSENEKNLDCRI